MFLTKNLTLDELTVSQEAVRSGLPNKPTDAHILNLVSLCSTILQPLRDKVKKPLVVSSGFRSPSVNRRIGGSKSSQHTKGQAADFTIPGMSVADTVALIRRMGLPFDQLINEGGAWVHVSIGPLNRGQVLMATFKDGSATYKDIT